METYFTGIVVIIIVSLVLFVLGVSVNMPSMSDNVDEYLRKDTKNLYRSLIAIDIGCFSLAVWNAIAAIFIIPHFNGVLIFTIIGTIIGFVLLRTIKKYKEEWKKYW